MGIQPDVLVCRSEYPLTEDIRGKIALFGGVKNARFRRQVVPGDVLTLECELVEQHGPVGIGKATAWVDGVRAANAELTFVITDA